MSHSEGNPRTIYRLTKGVSIHRLSVRPSVDLKNQHDVAHFSIELIHYKTLDIDMLLPAPFVVTPSTNMKPILPKSNHATPKRKFDEHHSGAASSSSSSCHSSTSSNVLLELMMHRQSHSSSTESFDAPLLFSSDHDHAMDHHHFSETLKQPRQPPQQQQQCLNERRQPYITCETDACDERFDTIKEYKQHLAQHKWGPHKVTSVFNTNNNNNNSSSFLQYECLAPGCGKIMTDRKLLRKHLLTHQEKKFVCHYDGCGKRFYERAKLKRHYLVHTGEKTFHCPFDGCDKAFGYKANLKTHMRVHTGQRPYECTFPNCDRTFAQASNRNSHVLTHQSLSSKNKSGEVVLGESGVKGPSSCTNNHNHQQQQQQSSSLGGLFHPPPSVVRTRKPRRQAAAAAARGDHLNKPPMKKKQTNPTNPLINPNPLQLLCPSPRTNNNNTERSRHLLSPGFQLLFDTTSFSDTDESSSSSTSSSQASPCSSLQRSPVVLGFNHHEQPPRSSSSSSSPNLNSYVLPNSSPLGFMFKFPTTPRFFFHEDDESKDNQEGEEEEEDDLAQWREFHAQDYMIDGDHHLHSGNSPSEYPHEDGAQNEQLKASLWSLPDNMFSILSPSAPCTQTSPMLFPHFE